MARPLYDNSGHVYRITGSLKLEGPVEVTLSFGHVSIGEGDTSMVRPTGADGILRYKTTIDGNGDRGIEIITKHVVVDTIGPNSRMPTMTF